MAGLKPQTKPIADTLEESGGAKLTLGAIPDTTILQRSGTSIVGTAAGGIDPDAIHDNVAGEIAAIANKPTPVGGDFLLIEDSADANNKKSITISSLPDIGDDVSVNGTPVTNPNLNDTTPAAPAGAVNVAWQAAGAGDPEAVSANVQGATTTQRGVVELATDGEVAADVVVQGNDSRLSNARTPTGAAGGDLTGTYPNPGVVAASTTVAGKVELATDGEVAAGLAVQANDSRLSNARTPTGAAGGDLTGTYPNPGVVAASTTVAGKVELATDGEVAAGLAVQANDSRLSDARTPTGAAGGSLGGTYPNPTVNDGADGSAIHDNIAGEIAAIALKPTPVAGDFLVIEDSADANAKKSITIGSLPGGGGGDNVSVNGSAVTNPNLNNTTPAAPAGEVNVKWQAAGAGDPEAVSASVQAGTTTQRGVVELATDGEVAADVVVQGNDSRLSNARTPTGAAGGDLTGTYPNPTVAVNAIGNTKLAQMAANTVKANATGALADPADVAVGANTVLGRAGGNIVAAQVVTAQVANDAIDNTKLANMAANTVKANATAGSADPADLAVGTNTVVGRVGGNIVAAQLATAQVANNAIDNTKIADMAQSTLKGRAVAAGTGDPTDLTAAQATAILDLFTSTLKGLAPASGGGTTNFLRADGTWAAPPGGGGGTARDTLTWVVNGKPAIEAGIDGRWIAPRAGNIRRITLWQGTQGNGASSTCDVNLDGTTVFTTQANRPSIAFGAGNNAISARNNMDVIAFAQDQQISVDIDAIQTGNPLNLRITIEVEYS